MACGLSAPEFTLVRCLDNEPRCYGDQFGEFDLKWIRTQWGERFFDSPRRLLIVTPRHNLHECDLSIRSYAESQT